MEDKTLMQTIKDFLFSNLNKQFVSFIFFLVLSAFFWLFMTMNESYEQELRVPVYITNVPKNIVLTSAPVDTIQLTVRDRGWMLLSYMFGDKKPKLIINFRNYDKGQGFGLLTAADIKRMADQEIESSTRLVSIKPEKMEYFYNNGERKRVPVSWAGRVMPDQLYFISHISYSPDSVDVYASREKLDSIRVVYSEPLNYVGFRDKLTVNSKLAHGNDVKVTPDHIQIEFHTDVLTEESKNIPVKCINLPPGKLLRTFPAKVKVNFVIGVSQLKSLREEDFLVVADYLEIEQKPSEKCNLYLRSTPKGISNATLAIKQVDYLIEEE